MKKTINETREMMNKINEFLSEDFGTARTAAEKFKQKYATELQGQEAARTNDDSIDWLHDTVWAFCDKNYPEHMGDEELSEKFVQSVIAEIQKEVKEDMNV